MFDSNRMELINNQSKEPLDLLLTNSEMQELKDVIEDVVVEKPEIPIIGELATKEVLIKMDSVIEGREEKLETNEQQVLFWFLTKAEEELIGIKGTERDQNDLTKITDKLTRIYQLKIRMTEAKTEKPMNILRKEKIEKLSNIRNSEVKYWRGLRGIIEGIKELQGKREKFEELRNETKSLEDNLVFLEKARKIEREATRKDNGLIEQVKKQKIRVDQLDKIIDGLKIEIIEITELEKLPDSNQRLNDLSSSRIGMINGMINNLEEKLRPQQKKIDEVVFKDIWGLKKK